MKDLYYSPKEKLLFCIAGYPRDTLFPYLVIEEMQKHIAEFCKIAQVDSKEVKMIFQVLSSMRYKHMRVYYTNVENPPTDAFVIGEDWDMFKWIES